MNFIKLLLAWLKSIISPAPTVPSVYEPVFVTPVAVPIVEAAPIEPTPPVSAPEAVTVEVPVVAAKKPRRKAVVK
jgi:hypothetical protein